MVQQDKFRANGTDAPDSALQTGFTGITETESSATAKK